MRRKRKLFYTVETQGLYWWVEGLRKWVHSNDIDKRGKHACSNMKECKTFDQAYKIARKVPSGDVVITQWYWRKGHRWCRDYHLKDER